MSVEEKKEVEEYKSGLTLRSLLLGLIIFFPAYITVVLMCNCTARPGTFSGFIIPVVYYLLINELVGRIKSNWKLTPQEMTVFIVPIFLLTGIDLLYVGIPNESIPFHMGGWAGLLIRGLSEEPYASLLRKVMPSWLAPTDPSIIAMAYRGLMPGESMNWGPWIPSLLYLSFIYSLTMITGYLWGYLLRRPLIEIEKLPCPLARPFAEANVVIAQIDPETKKSRLFNLHDPWSRTFWIFFFIGTIGSIVAFITEIYPVIPLAAFWGEIPIELSPYTRSVLPAAWFDMVFHVKGVPLALLMPTDVLLTVVIVWFVMGVLYQTIGVITGFLPYVPETEGTFYYGVRPPFPWRYFGITGVTLGVGIWTIWMAWPWLKESFSSLIKGKDVVDSGVSMRRLWMGIIIVTLIWIITWVASGAAFLPTLFTLALWIIWNYAVTRAYSTCYHNPHHAFAASYWPLIWACGVGTGAWSPSIPVESTTGFMTLFLMGYTGSWNYRFSPYSMFSSFQLYYVAERSKTKARDVLIALVIFSLLGAFFGSFFNLWWWHHTGGLVGQGYDYGTAGTIGDIGDWGVLSWGMRFGLDLYSSLTVAGIVFTLIIAYLRTIFPWFFIHPIGLMWALRSMYMWSTCLAGLIIKILVLRIGGPELFEKRVIPAVTGFLLGYGSPFILGAFYRMSTEALPTFYAKYIP